MNRVLGLLMVVAVCGSVKAETVRYSLGTASNGEGFDKLPAEFVGGVAFNNDVDWFIPNLTAHDAGTLFELNAGNAIDYGIAMDDVTNAMLSGFFNPPGKAWTKPFIKTSDGQHLVGDMGIPQFNFVGGPVVFEVVSVEYRLRDMSQAVAEAWITVVIPEPSTAVLFVISLLAMLGHRSKRLPT